MSTSRHKRIVVGLQTHDFSRLRSTSGIFGQNDIDPWKNLWDPSLP